MIERDNSPTSLPLYQQVSEFLIREIAAGRLLNGQRLPPERTLAGHHGITVRTLRKALLELEQRGLLERVQGSGNYIRTTSDVQSIYSLFRLELHEGGGLPTANILDIRLLAKPDGFPAFGPAHDATRIRRLRFLNQIAVAIEEIWLDPQQRRGDGGGCVRLALPHLSKHVGFLDQPDQRQSTGCARTGLGTACLCDAGWNPSGFVERLSWAQAEHPVEYSRTWFDPSRANYVQRIS